MSGNDLVLVALGQLAIEFPVLTTFTAAGSQARVIARSLPERVETNQGRASVSDKVEFRQCRQHPPRESGRMLHMDDPGFVIDQGKPSVDYAQVGPGLVECR